MIPLWFQTCVKSFHTKLFMQVLNLTKEFNIRSIIFRFRQGEWGDINVSDRF